MYLVDPCNLHLTQVTFESKVGAIAMLFTGVGLVAYFSFKIYRYVCFEDHLYDYLSVYTDMLLDHVPCALSKLLKLRRYAGI